MRVRSYVKAALFLPLILAGMPGSGPAFAQGPEKPIRVVEGAEKGVRMEILNLKRSEGGMLTLRIAYVNDSGGQVKNSVLPGAGNVADFALLDYANRRKYKVVYDTGGSCLCTSLNPYGATDPGRFVFWAKFAAPPESVNHVSLLMPGAEPVDDVPLSR